MPTFMLKVRGGIVPKLYSNEPVQKGPHIGVDLDFFNYGSDYEYKSSNQTCFKRGGNTSSTCSSELEKEFTDVFDGEDRCVCDNPLYAPKNGGTGDQTIYHCAEKQLLSLR